jgi:soluble lytic murein transglycosylase-like protein
VRPTLAQSAPSSADTIPVWHRLVGLALDSTWVDDSLSWAQVELALNRPERALRVLGPLADSAAPGLGFEIAAHAAYAAGEFNRAAAFFLRAADGVLGSDRGILVARAGDAYEAAGLPDSAAPLYRQAGRLLPLIGGWLRVREARVTSEPIREFRLLRGAPPEAQAEAALLRAPLLLSAGDTVRAIGAFVAGRAFPKATILALAQGDLTAAREWLEQSLEHSPPDSLSDLVAVLDAKPWPTPAQDDISRLVRLNSRVGRTDSALGLLERWSASFSDTLRLLRLRGDLLSNSGRTDEAEAAYSQAMRGTGSQAALAEYQRALLLRRIGRATEGWRALEEFTRHWPQARETPSALLLLGERFRDRGLRARADSVLRILVGDWPRSRAAGRARMALAGSALSQHDTVAAVEWYEHAMAERGPEQPVAMAELARIEALRQDTARAQEIWRALLRTDSFGYYGMLARQNMGSDAPEIPPTVSDVVDDPQAMTLERRVSLLFAVGFDAELEAFVSYHAEEDRSSVPERIALARFLIEHGRPAEGIRIGWQLTDTLSLADPRVLRLIYPWPLRPLIEREAAELGLDPYLLVGLIRQESAFRPQVTSRAGARGLMQLMPTTASWLAGRLGLEWDDRFLGVADANLHIGAVHLANLLRQYDDDVVFALAAYNAGSTVVNRWRRAMRNVSGVRFVEGIPYAETRGFVQAVLRNGYLYRALYPPQP